MSHLVLITDGFPIKKGSEPFLEEEFAFLTKKVSNLEVCADITGSDNIEYRNDIFEYQYSKKLSNYLISLCHLTFWKEVFLEVLNHRNINVAKIKIALDYFCKAIDFKRFIETSENIKTASIYYTYWMTPKTLGLCLANKKVFSRAHGFDVYFERHPHNYLPFRGSILDSVQKLGIISKQGNDYLTKKFKKYQNKIETHYLGVDVPEFIPAQKRDFKIIVSCSSLIELKQVDKIIDAFKKVKHPIKWHHFGDGPLKNILKEKGKKIPTNIEVNWQGHLPKKEILDFYKKYKPDLFINASKFEGIPVSIMEAHAHSIPAIAPKVGGISEVMQTSHELLIDENVSASNLAEKIEEYISAPENIVEAIRKNVHENIHLNFNTEVNYANWLKSIYPIS